MQVSSLFRCSLIYTLHLPGSFLRKDAVVVMYVLCKHCLSLYQIINCKGTLFTFCKHLRLNGCEDNKIYCTT